MRRLFLLSLIALLTLALTAPVAGAAKRKISLTAAKAKVLKHFRTGTDGTYAIKCARTSARKATCYLVRTSGTSAPCGRGEAKLNRRGRVVASSWGYECASIPARMRPAGVTLPTAVDSGPVPAPEQPGAPAADAPPPPPAAPATTALSGTYVCLTGIIAQVRPAGPAPDPELGTGIEPIPVPLTGLEPPLKFTLKPDGTYSNITFGAVYANDPKWQGTYTVNGDRVRLLTPTGTPLVTYDFLRRQDTAGTLYLIEDAPANEAYKANVCRAIA
ncbi:MAG TPA: hypothetical protein VF587_17990 [Solirubrobacteraceae bacterium]|jgi:hypothetical protein